METKVVSTQDVIERYYSSQSHKDDQWKDLWSRNAVFSDASQTLQATGRDAVIQSFTPFLKSVARLKISRKIVQAGEACFIISYTYVNSKAETMDQDVAEVWEVRDGKLAKLTIYFDLTAYRRFMQG